MVRRVNIKNLVLRDGVYYFRMAVKRPDGSFKAIRQSLGTTDFDMAVVKMINQRRLYMLIARLDIPDNYDKSIRDINDYKSRISENDDVAKNAIAKEFEHLSDEELVDRLVRCQEIIEACHGEEQPAGKNILNTLKFVSLEANKLQIAYNERYNHEVMVATGNLPEDDFTFTPRIYKLYEFAASRIGARCKNLLELEDRYAVCVPLTTAPAARCLQTVAQPIQIPKHSIRTIVEEMTERNADSHKGRTMDNIARWLKTIDVNIDDPYDKINNPSIMAQIAKNIKNATDMTNDTKNEYLGQIEKLVKQANLKEPDHYLKEKLIYQLSRLPKASKSEKKPFGMFSDAMLSKIFDTDNSCFQKYPEIFLADMIGLYAGARTTAAITLQFGDFKQREGCWYIEFCRNNEFKRLKNDATEREWPISKQLVDWGLPQLIKNKQKQTNAKDTDFIFTRTNLFLTDEKQRKSTNTTSQRTKKEPAAKWFGPQKSYWIKHLNIVNTEKEQFAFHSFRKTASHTASKFGVDEEMKNKLIGWEGKTTQQRYYSPKEFLEIKESSDKMYYPEEVLHLEAWKPIIRDLYLHPEKISKQRGSYKKKINID